MSTAYEVVAAVKDPELPVITIAELGVLREVSTQDGHVTVTITPTYSGCPAMDAIRSDIVVSLAKAGYRDVEVITKLAPAWSTDMISESGREALARHGIAPPSRAGAGPVPVTIAARLATSGEPVIEARGASGDLASGGGRAAPSRSGRGAVAPECPRCGSSDVSEISRYGSTACQSLWRCHRCIEPFNAVKPL